MARHSLFSLLRHAVGGHRLWPRQWHHCPRPKSRYRVVIVGGGAHGLATAWHLARDHGIADVAVLEAGWLGGGNTARNTTIIHSAYLHPASAALYDQALGQWETLARDLDHNVMFSPRGVLALAHDTAGARALRRRLCANRLQGIAGEWLEPAAAAALCPLLRVDGERWPVVGATLQRRGGIARHDAVAWGYARAAARRGADLVEHCPVSAVLVEDGRAVGVETPHGPVRADAVLLAAAGGTPALLPPGITLPLTVRPFQAFVTEPVQPVLDMVVMSAALGVAISQSDKGELVLAAAGADRYPSQARRGSPLLLEAAAAHALDLFPRLSRMRMLRAWAGLVDVTPDAAPILGESGLPGLLLACGWGTGGFKATPAAGLVMAHHLATGRPHPLAAPFTLDRFRTGARIDGPGAAFPGDSAPCC